MDCYGLWVRTVEKRVGYKCCSPRLSKIHVTMKPTFLQIGGVQKCWRKMISVHALEAFCVRHCRKSNVVQFESQKRLMMVRQSLWGTKRKTPMKLGGIWAGLNILIIEG